MSSSVPDIVKVIDRRLEKALPIFMNKLKEAVDKSVDKAVDNFYSDYSLKVLDNPLLKEYEREGDLAEIVNVEILGSGINDTAVKIDINHMYKPSWHYERKDGVLTIVEGYPEDIYQSVFIEGYHGGRGDSHTLWGRKEAKQSEESPFDTVVKEIKTYANGQAQADFKSAYDSAN